MIEAIAKGVGAVVAALVEYFTARSDEQRKAARAKADQAVAEFFELVDGHLLDHDAEIDREVDQKFGPKP